MITSFPDGPRSSSPPMQAVDDVSHRRRRMGGVVLNERGEPVLHWPDVIPDGWSVVVDASWRWTRPGCSTVRPVRRAARP